MNADLNLILVATRANTGNRFLFSNNRFIKYNPGRYAPRPDSTVKLT